MQKIIRALALILFTALLTACGEKIDKEAEAAQKITQTFFDELF